MPSRRRSRQSALQILYLWDARRQPVDEATAAYYDSLYCGGAARSASAFVSEPGDAAPSPTWRK